MLQAAFYQFALSNRELPPRAVLQAIITRWDLLLPTTLLEVGADAGALSRAEFGGIPASFACERRTVESVVSRWHPELETRWQIAYAFGAFEDMLSSLAAGIAALSLAEAINGVFYLPETGPLTDVGPFRKHMDTILAVHCGGIDLFRRRYPEDIEDHSGEPLTVTSKIVGRKGSTTTG